MNILNKLTFNNLKINKGRTIATIIGILLSTALITVVSSMATSARATLVDIEIRSSGDYELEFFGNLKNEAKKTAEAHRDVEDAYLFYDIGLAKNENSLTKFDMYTNVAAVSPDAFDNCFRIKLSDGRFPENENELLLVKELSTVSQKNYKVGDKLTLELGTRWYNSPGSQAGDYLTDKFYYKTGEKFVGEFLKTYTVVGIAENVYGEIGSFYGSAFPMVYTAASDDIENAQRTAKADDGRLYVRLKKGHEDKYADVAADLLGADPELIRMYFSGELEEEQSNILQLQIKNNPLGSYFFSSHSSLIRYFSVKGMSDTAQNAVFAVAVIISLIIVISSIFIIRNSFAISINSKTKLYGMMLSVGATPRQIRRNVFFEGTVLGLLGIPLGIVLGMGTSAALIGILNNILTKDMPFGGQFILKYEWYGIVFAIALSAVTILFSTLSTALRASKLPPISAIRGSKDVLVKKSGKDKSYKSPALVKKLFGIGGSIAWKNLKRSRRQYRTTVISIIVSVAVYISIFSFVQLSTKYADERIGPNTDFNFFINANMPSDILAIDKSYEKISALESVSKAVSFYSSPLSYTTQLDEKQFTKEYYEFNKDLWVDKKPSLNNGKLTAYVNFIAFDDTTYKKLVYFFGYNYQEVKDKGILYNTFIAEGESIFAADNSENGVFESDFLKRPKGTVITCETGKSEDGEKKSSKATIEIAESFVLNDLYRNADESLRPDELVITQITETNSQVIVSKDWFAKNIDTDYCFANLSLNTSDGKAIEQIADKVITEDVTLMNNISRVESFKSLMVAVQIFAYGFIIIITLIGVTNIFNTVNTNIKLRRREFAMLRSVGMTGKEFNAMIRLESVFYTTKALVFGIPIGFLLSALIYLAISANDTTFTYNFPALAVIISILAALIIVWMIMRFSISKIKKQNIIETIRQDNI